MPFSRMLAPAALLLVLLASPRPAAAAYSQVELAGTWRSQTLASGPGAPWWERSRAVISPGGDLVSIAIDNFGDRDTTEGTLVLAADGVITSGAPTPFLGALDMGRTVMAGTDVWSEDGTAELRIALRDLGGHVTPDLAGEWEFHSIVSGPSAPWWIHGRQTVLPNGSFTGTTTESSGATQVVSGTMLATPETGVSISFAPQATGWIDAAGTVLVMTNTWPDGSTELITGLRMASSYAQADLAGTWQVRSLATGPGAPWWSHGQIVIAADGSFAGSITDSEGAMDPIAGTFALSPTGVVTRTGASSAHGALDAGRSVMVWTDTWTTGSPGTTELMIGVRTDGSTAGVPASAHTALSLERITPNPSHGARLTARFTLATAGPASLELLDVAGRVLVSQPTAGAGPREATLAPARPLPPGLYFVRLVQAGQSLTQRVAWLR